MAIDRSWASNHTNFTDIFPKSSPIMKLKAFPCPIKLAYLHIQRPFSISTKSPQDLRVHFRVPYCPQHHQRRQVCRNCLWAEGKVKQGLDTTYLMSFAMVYGWSVNLADPWAATTTFLNSSASKYVTVISIPLTDENISRASWKETNCPLRRTWSGTASGFVKAR